jgi:hypothetical protein
MLYWVRARHFFGLLAAAVLAGGCSGGASPAAPATNLQVAAARFTSSLDRRIAASNSLGIVPVRHLNRGPSWMLPDAKSKWLLYVSDGATGTVDVYDYGSKAGKLYGQITGLAFPYGQCIDSGGNIYVVDNDTGKIYEFAHGGTTPVATVTDKFGFPTGCSVNPKNGDMAIANFANVASGGGGLVIASGGLSGKQTNYEDPALYRAFPPGYDPSGNLFVQGADYSGVPSFLELPAGKKKFKPLNGLAVGFPGSVAWDGKYLAATDQNYQFNYTTMIYRITVTGGQVTIVRKTDLTDTCYPYHNWMVAIQPFVTGMGGKENVVVAGNLNCPSRENYFSYTKGGNPTRSIDPSIAPKAPYGQVVSPP